MITVITFHIVRYTQVTGIVTCALLTAGIEERRPLCPFITVRVSSVAANVATFFDVVGRLHCRTAACCSFYSIYRLDDRLV